MSVSFLGFLSAFVTDPVYGIPLLLWLGVAILWLAWGKGTAAPLLQPYHTPRVRSRDPVSAMYWAISERRYSDTIIFVYQRLAGAFQRRYQIPITSIPWRRKLREAHGLYDARPYHRVMREMVNGLNTAQMLEQRPTFRPVWELLRSTRERRLQRHLDTILSTVEWMVPELEAPA